MVVEAPGLAGAQGIALLERMLLIRRFEDAVQRLFQRGEVHGTTHLYSGQEAGAVGVCAALSAGDRVAGTYRGHGHALALGVDPQGLMDELLGRASGVCGGRAGSMNVVDHEHGLVGWVFDKSDFTDSRLYHADHKHILRPKARSKAV